MEESLITESPQLIAGTVLAPACSDASQQQDVAWEESLQQKTRQIEELSLALAELESNKEQTSAPHKEEESIAETRELQPI
mgnify:CR=1 FL=1